MPRFLNPTSSQVQDFLLRLYFGYRHDYLTGAISKAYADLSRTVHGIARHDPQGKLRQNASAYLHDKLCSLPTQFSSQESFDRWHELTAAGLRDLYLASGYPNFHVGQAQKWLNMAVKYAALLGDLCVPGANALFAIGHVPVDSFLIKQLAAHGLPDPNRFEPWSRIDSYFNYMSLQRWIREQFPESTPLAVEFHLWQQAASRAGAA
jgi:hypothetical protein